MKCLKTIKPMQDDAVYQYIMKKESEGKAKKVAKVVKRNCHFVRIRDFHSTIK